MKRILALMLALVMIFALAACGNKEGKQEAAPAALTLAEDTTLMRLQFTPPEGYETVERFTEQTADGTLTEKNLAYSFADGRKVTYAYATGQKISDVIDLSTLESIEHGGETFYFYGSGKEHMAFVETEDALYGLDYVAIDDGGRAALEEVIAGVSFSDGAEVIVNDLDLWDIAYTIDPSLPLHKTSITLAGDPAGNITQKSVIWTFGDDDQNIDFRFLIRVFKNSTVEEQKKDGKVYEEKTVGETTYTVLIPDDGAPYEYYTQHGDDVYQLRNNGRSDGWFGVSRSDESVAAFEAFVNSVSFK